MSFLLENSTQNLAARITNKGRKKIVQGNFSISYFQLGDSEYDYGFSEFDGINNPSQKVLMPFDKDSQVKYPYKISESTLTGTTFGTPVMGSQTEIVTNIMGAAGYVSEYVAYDDILGAGTSVVCDFEYVSLSAINGTSSLTVPDGTTFYPIDSFITIMTGQLVGSNNIISDNVMSLVYRVIGISGNVLTLDRNMPDLSSVTGYATIIRNDCDFSPILPSDQQDPWMLNTVWSQNPAGLDPSSNVIDEKLTGYTSNAFVSTKEFFGYNTSSGQTYNTGTTITNAFGDMIPVPPEEQHSLSIIHYSKVGDILTDPDLIFKYEDYIAHTETDDIEYFEIYIPFLCYERNTTPTIGARFFMDTVDYYINSSAVDTRINQMKYRYLLDEQGIRVGKIFVNHKVIVFDDQEIVAVLDYKSNRRFTLPIPRVLLVPTDSKCDTNGDILNPLLSGTTSETIFVTYLLEYTGDMGLTGLHCNHYGKLVGGTTDGDVSIKFNTNDFQFMRTLLDDAAVYGYIADKFSILAQKVVTGTQPDPTGWRIIDMTAEIPGHTVGFIIDPAMLSGNRFIITYSDYDNAPLYVLTDPDLIDTTTSPEFGDEQPFTGSVKLVRATDFEVMRYLINLPSGNFETTQNPSYVIGKPKRITEVALYDENRDMVVIAKASSPIIRTGSQVLAVKIDL